MVKFNKKNSKKLLVLSMKVQQKKIVIWLRK